MGTGAKFAVAAVVVVIATSAGHAYTTGPETASANERLGMRMAAAAGWDAAQRHCLNWLWTRESGWRDDVWNYQGSGAYGIPQALPASKMAAAGPDWRTDPATQIRYGLGYIRAVYGEPCRAWQHEEEKSWY